jgi:hypothetical protein
LAKEGRLLGVEGLLEMLGRRSGGHRLFDKGPMLLLPPVTTAILF